MFNMVRPCHNCPFRKGQGELFGFHQKRLDEIVVATAFQCHKTVDYSGNGPEQGDRPQQCAGLMAVLHREGKANSIMQVAERLGHFDPARLDPDNEAYSSLDEVYAAHDARRLGRR